MKAMCADINKRYASATAMLEDLENFRKDPELDLEYIREELSEKEDTEPTRYISKKEISEAVRTNKKEQADKAEKTEKTSIAGTKQEKKRMAILVGAFAGALLAIFLIFTLVSGGFKGDTGADGYKVPNIVGMTVEEAEKLQSINGIFKIEVIGTKESSQFSEALKDTSVVVASYDIGDDMRGLIGVVGPTRMDYATVAARLSGFAEGLTRLFGKQELPPKEDTKE